MINDTHTTARLSYALQVMAGYVALLDGPPGEWDAWGCPGRSLLAFQVSAEGNISHCCRCCSVVTAITKRQQMG